MLRLVLRSLVRAAVVVGAVSSVAGGCSRQAEGERCDFVWAGDQDCDSGLTCTRCGLLQDHTNSRCCRPDGTYTDTRCIPTTNPTSDQCDTHLGTGGTSSTSTGGTAGAPDEAGATGGTGGTAGTSSSTAGMSGSGGTEETAGIGGAPADGG